MASANRLIEAFDEAKTRPAGAERERFLAEACRGEPALKEQVLSLLQAHDGAGDFLKHTLLLPPVTPLTEKPGDRIGRYKLLEQIGEGGCGVVYMADQEEPVRRRVALKVIKLGMDTKQVIARFEAERQALAMMDHPNIAKVLDAGATDTGRPFFVMELVRGIKITDYCDQNNLSTNERLELFMQVCQAVQHAHQKGIIHRDIKPSNILVTQHDDVAVPKVIDFGIAKATIGHLTDKTLFTAFAQFMGTPAYMSPEQAQMSGLDIDTRADIYSLGVLLYELLTGSTPFDAKELLAAGMDEMRRKIREDEPAKPSTCLSTMQAMDLTTVARHRHVEPPRLIHLIRGDLDWLVMKCLEKDRTRRYATANALAMDLQRHLNDEPVVACPPSRLYEFRKTVRRHKFGFAAAAALIIALGLGVLGSTLQAVRATRAEREQTRLRGQAEDARNSETRERTKAEANAKKAASEAAKSQQVAQFMKDMLKGVGPSVALGRDTTMLREILDRTADRIGKALTNQPEVEVELRAILTLTYEELALFKQREEMARETLRVSRSRLGEEHPVVADALHQIGDARSRLGDQAEAEKFMREAVALKRKVLGNEHPSTAASVNVLAWVVMRQDKLTEAEMLGREALAIRRKLFGNEHRDVADSIYLLATVMERQNKLAESEALHREALAMARRVLGEEHPAVAESLNNLAGVLRREGKLAEAETLHREALARRRKLFGPDHPEVAESLRNLALVLRTQGKLAEVETLYREELANRKKLLGNEQLDAAQILSDLSLVLREQGKLPEAEIMLREVIARYEKSASNSPKKPDYWQQLARDHNQLGILLRNDGRKQEAEDELRKAQELWRAHSGPELERLKKAAESDPENGLRWGDLAIAYCRFGNGEASLEIFKTKEHLGYGIAGSAWQWFYIAMAHWQMDNRAEARNWFYKSIGWMDDAQEIKLRDLQAEAAALLGLPDPWERSAKASTYFKQGNAYQQQGEMEKAKAPYGHAIGLYESLVADFPTVPAYQMKLVDLLTKSGRQQEAGEVNRKIITQLEKLADSVEVRTYRGTFYRDLGEVDKAIADFSWVMAKDPKRAEVWDLRGNCYLRKGEYAKAVADYSHAIELKPRLGWYWHERAYAHLVLGQHEQAIADHSTAIEISDIDSGQRLRRGQSYEALGELEKAEADYARASKLNPSDILVTQSLVRLLKSANKLAEAESLLKDLLSQQRQSPGEPQLVVVLTMLNLADVLKQQNKADEAVNRYREALEIASHLRADATNANALNSAAWQLVTAGNSTSWDAAVAVELAQKAVAATNRKNPLMLDTLAAAHAAAGQFTNAVPVQQEAIALLQDDSKIKDYVSRLELYKSGFPYRDYAALARSVSALLAQRKFAEAEPLARECLALREKQIPDDWLTFNARSMLGGSLLGQKKNAEAEPLLLSGYAGMKQREDKIPAIGKPRVKETLQRLVQLYEATGQSEKTAEWNKELAEFDQAEAGKKTAASNP